MKILMVTMKMDIGGAETHILELCRELKKAGHVITLFPTGGSTRTCWLLRELRM